MKHAKKYRILSLILNIVLVIALFAVSWRAGFVKKAVNMVFPAFANSADIIGSAAYDDRISLFQAYPSSTKNVVFIGDSITQLCDFNELLGFDISLNRGINGDTTEGVLNRLDEIVSINPSKIFLLIGINDLQRGVTIETASISYSGILKGLREALPSADIYAESVLPANLRTVNDSQIIALNKEIKRISDQNGAIYIDLYSKMVGRDGLISSDGVHLTGNGYLVLKETIVGYAND